MHTVDLLERSLDACRRHGYMIRQEWLGGAGGGVCEIKGRKCIFVDLSLSPDEQLEQLWQGLEAVGLTLPVVQLPDEPAEKLRKSA